MLTSLLSSTENSRLSLWPPILAWIAALIVGVVELAMILIGACGVALVILAVVFGLGSLS